MVTHQCCTMMSPDCHATCIYLSKGDSGLKFEVADLTVDVLRQMLYLEDAQAASDLTEHRGETQPNSALKRPLVHWSV